MVKSILQKTKNSLEISATVDYLETLDERIFLKLVICEGESVTIEVTSILENILEDNFVITNKNLQKIYRYLPNKIRYKKDSNKIPYVDKLTLYKTLYKACSKASLAKTKIYNE